MTTVAELIINLLPGCGHLLQGSKDTSSPRRESEDQSVGQRVCWRAVTSTKDSLTATVGEEITHACSEVHVISWLS